MDKKELSKKIDQIFIAGVICGALIATIVFVVLFLS